MNDKQPDQPPATPNQPPIDPVSPDALMADFRGKKLTKIVVFTVIVHAVFIGVFSFGYIKDRIVGESGEPMSDEARLEVAMNEGTAALREIADRHKIDVQDLSSDLSSRFNGGVSRGSMPGTSSPSPVSPQPDPEASPDSEYQRDLERQLTPPAEPDLTPALEDEDPIFPAP